MSSLCARESLLLCLNCILFLCVTLFVSVYIKSLSHNAMEWSVIVGFAVSWSCLLFSFTEMGILQYRHKLVFILYFNSIVYKSPNNKLMVILRKNK